jgi:FtsP/CotA-like multicopper oxidase with cupredoxin domain
LDWNDQQGEKNIMKNDERDSGKLTRRDFLRIGGSGALAVLVAGAGVTKLLRPSAAALAAPTKALALQSLPRVDIRLWATDGYVSLPGRRVSDGKGLYVFGFGGVESGEEFWKPRRLIRKYKGKVTWPSPIIGVPKDVELYITLTNLGLEVRPDLDDAHTIHWHGFRNPNAVFDGVPEVSISVPPARDFPYFYVPRDEGTYMYHCHFEDVEHVQMGMDGIVYIEADNGNVYDFDDGATAFARQFALLLNEVDTTPHDNLEAVQEFVWTDYKANYWVINGRSYPDTVVRDQDLGSTDFAESQPDSSLIQLNTGEIGLLRFANLGYEQHTMQLLGIPMTVVGQDAGYLGDQSYQTSSIYIGPGEARDVLITAPAYSGSNPGGTDGAGNYNVYWLRNRNSQRMTNNGAVDPATGLGGMVTEVRVYADALPSQTRPNETF